jgi:hypothetical protein
MTQRFQFKYLLAVIGLSTIGVWLLFGWLGTSAARSAVAHPIGPIDSLAPVVITPTYPNCRLGVGMSGPPDSYNFAPLNLGWYLDWHTALTPTHPNSADYAQVIRIESTIDGGFVFSPPTATLQAIVAANPGAVWLIGNEPDSPSQDNLVPELYARAYRHLYQLIKTVDPTARLGAGSIVQPTPLRLQYLDQVLAAYRAYYSQTLPADLWNIHSYILREITFDDPEAMNNGGPYAVWGAYVPPGINATRGELYTESQMFSIPIFRQRLIDFRAWMARNGYRDLPLLITEYGTLYPYPPYDIDYYYDEFGVPLTEDRTAAFLTQTYDVLLTLTDTAIGYPADGNRIVQRWAWYSVNDPIYGGILYYTDTHTLNPLGAVYAAYAQNLPPAADVNARAQSQAAPWTGDPVTVTLSAVIGNQGNISANLPITMAFSDNPIGSGNPIRLVQIPTGTLAGCGGSIIVTATRVLSTAGAHPFYVIADSTGRLSESDETNNVSQGVVLLSTEQVYLPVVRR